jgi:hypothetical protein
MTVGDCQPKYLQPISVGIFDIKKLYDFQKEGSGLPSRPYQNNRQVLQNSWVLLHKFVYTRDNVNSESITIALPLLRIQNSWVLLHSFIYTRDNVNSESINSPDVWGNWQIQLC